MGTGPLTPVAVIGLVTATGVRDGVLYCASGPESNPLGVKCPPAGVVRKFGEGVQPQVFPHNQTMVQNYEIRPKMAGFKAGCK
ncbi:hypothetical protein AVEN_111032-1 [Araneus ventricosus]|uniref:Uncharacterized protein n=1 Tax=Araneus ventricosus TaxID=182803 RepID=A0A4Y2GBZ7_ARAVE|nr:hypothetical protein AVEN_111032-1 [Araneus ventricosus]